MTLTVLPERDKLGLRDGRLFIDGEWTDGGDGETWTHVHPATGEEIGRFAVATHADVDRAVRAARAAFDEWQTWKARERVRLLLRISAAVASHIDELNGIQTLDNSVPASFGNIYQLGAQMTADI